MSVRSLARIAAVLFAASVLVALVYAAQPAATLPSPPLEVAGERLPDSHPAQGMRPSQLLPSTKADLPMQEVNVPNVPVERRLLPATKAGPIPREILQPPPPQAPPIPNAPVQQKKVP